VSFEDDRGGNIIGISGGLCSWDLHAVWDRCIIEQGSRRGARSLAGLKPDGLGERVLRDLGQPRVQYCVGSGTECWYGAGNERFNQGEPKKVVVVDRPYIEINTPTVSDRLVKAGVRLSGLLNQVLGE
jgi:hypothetical protein